MWICPLCDQQFVKNNQAHSCNDKTLSDFLNGKSAETIALFHEFIRQYRQIGKINIHPTKSMIGLAAVTRMVYITSSGKILWISFFLLTNLTMIIYASIR